MSSNVSFANSPAHSVTYSKGQPSLVMYVYVLYLSCRRKRRNPLKCSLPLDLLRSPSRGKSIWIDIMFFCCHYYYKIFVIFLKEKYLMKILFWSPTSCLCDIVKREEPNVILLLGPFVDVNNPQVLRWWSYIAQSWELSANILLTLYFGLLGGFWWIGDLVRWLFQWNVEWFVGCTNVGPCIKTVHRRAISQRCPPPHGLPAASF